MREWNVVATIHDGGFRRACRLLSLEGELSRTEFYNVVVMRVADLDVFLGRLEKLWSESRIFAEVVAHVRPVRETFDFQSPEEFEAKAKALALGLAERLAGKSFHVRIHRRGFKGRLSTKDEERLLADAVLARVSSIGASARVAFDDPDAVLAVDAVGDRAGMALWMRDDLRRYPFLGLGRAR
jgi:tRNA(Ser,Leu) C12 N-acetylase TAN1